MNPLLKRLGRLEDHRSGDGLRVIIVTGGLTDGVELIATDGVHQWRGDGESFEAFRDRVTAAAREAGANLIVFGGLPEH